jgi:hypothetical protein
MKSDPLRLDQPARIKGRGAASNPEGRFESLARTVEDDGWIAKTTARRVRQPS